MKPMQKEGPQ